MRLINRSIICQLLNRGLIVDEINRSIICQLLNKGLIVDEINRSIMCQLRINRGLIIDEMYRSNICQLLNKGLSVDKINRSINLLINSSGTKKRATRIQRLTSNTATKLSLFLMFSFECGVRQKYDFYS